MKGLYIKEDYLELIASFVLDEDISHQNSDDVDFFRSLLFDAHNFDGWIHTSFYQYYLRKLTVVISDRNVNQILSILDKYTSFMGKIHEYYRDDFFYHLFWDKDIALIEKLFEIMSPHNKVAMLSVITQFPKLVKASPKIKFYLLFS